MILYLDTSALFRLYVPETGREAVVEATERWEVRCTHLIAFAEKDKIEKAILELLDRTEGKRADSTTR